MSTSIPSVLLCAAPAAHAELYKWVDSKGLARDVKSGAASLANGNKTDAAGRATADNGIKAFCR